MPLHNVNEIQHKPDQENHPHDNGQYHPFVMVMGNIEQKTADKLIPIEFPECQIKGTCLENKPERYAAGISQPFVSRQPYI